MGQPYWAVVTQWACKCESRSASIGTQLILYFPGDDKLMKSHVRVVLPNETSPRMCSLLPVRIFGVKL